MHSSAMPIPTRGRSLTGRAVAFALLLAFALPTFVPTAAAQGEDGTVTVTSPASGATVTYYTSSTPLTLSCSTSKTPQTDPEFGGPGMAFAVRIAGVGGFNFAQGWDSTSPYSVTHTMAQWGINESGNHEVRCRIYNGGLYYWATRTFNVVVATSGEDGSVSMTSPSSGQSVTYYTSSTPLTISCSTSHTPQVDPDFGGAGMAFAVRVAGVGGFNFAQGWDSTSPYSVTQTMAQWGINESGDHEARCRVYENGLYYWSTRTFNVVVATSGEDGSVTMTAPSSGGSVSSSPVTVSCSTTHTAQVDPDFGGAGMAFAVRPAGSGGFNFAQGWDSTAPYSVSRTWSQWGITGPGSYEARCRVYENGLYFWATNTFWVTNDDTPTGCTFAATPNGLQVTVSVDATCQDPYGNPISFSWNWGDGTSSPNAGANPPAHTYGNAFCPSGTPTITLTAAATGPAATSSKAVALSSPDGDHDGLAKCREDIQQTDDTKVDTDGDGLGNGIQATVGGAVQTVYSDFVESRWFPNRGTVFCNNAAGCAADQYPDPRHKDIYVEMDYMDAAYLPTEGGLGVVVASFANSPDAGNPDGTGGIKLHLDGGNAYAAYNLGGGELVPYQAELGTYCGDWKPFDTLKGAHFDAARAGIFHYAVWADNQALGAKGCNGSSGRSHGIPGRDLMVSLGSFPGHGTDANRYGSFMHELGHNLGLHHGGFEDTNLKPNYLSVMNYAFQLDGIPRTGGAANEFSYSSFSDALVLDENALDERVGLGDANAAGYRTVWSCPAGGAPRMAPAAGSNGPLNWNCAGTDTEHPVRANLNGDGTHLDQADPKCNAGASAGCQRLQGSKDWGALTFSGIDPSYTPAGVDAGLVTVPLPVDLPLDPSQGTDSEYDPGPSEYQAIHDLFEQEGVLG